MTFFLAFLAVQGSAWTELAALPFEETWIKRGGEASFRIENGEIVGKTAPNTENTFLCTRKVYGDFELQFEVKVHPELNSGVQIRSHSVSGYREGRVFGPQVEIDPTDRAFSGGIYDESRRGWLMDLSQNEKGRKAFKNGYWNKYRVLSVGDRTQVWVNDVQTADLRDDLDMYGFIALQVHGVGDKKEPLEVRWRNLRIKDLGVRGSTPPPGAAALMTGASDAEKWEIIGKTGSKMPWKWVGDCFEVVPSSGSVSSRMTFDDCVAHVEFNVDDNGLKGQANGNSGVYLQGRYEVQILNSAGQEPALDNCGAIYSVKAPDFNMAFPAGEWQTYDIFFTSPRWGKGAKVASARMTVYHNGVKVHDNVEVPRHTTAGRAEGMEPGGLYLQDHGNHIRFRNVWILPK